MRNLNYPRGNGAPMSGRPDTTVARGPLPSAVSGDANIQSGPRHHAPLTTAALQRNTGQNPQPWLRSSASDNGPANAAAPHATFGASRTASRTLRQDEVTRIGTPHEVHANAAAPHAKI